MSLLMTGVEDGLLACWLPISALPPVDFTIQVTAQYPGESGRDGVLSHRPARTPVRRNQRPGANDFRERLAPPPLFCTNLDRNIDGAAQDVQAAINAASRSAEEHAAGIRRPTAK